VATLAYRLVNYWLPLPFGAAAYLRLRLRTADRRLDNPRPSGPAQVRAPGPAEDGDAGHAASAALEPGPAPVLTQFPGRSIDI